MLAVDGWLLESKVPVRMIMQVHDELVFEVADAFIEDATVEIQHFMCRAADMSVPLLVEVGVGGNWDEAH